MSLSKSHERLQIEEVREVLLNYVFWKAAIFRPSVFMSMSLNKFVTMNDSRLCLESVFFHTEIHIHY